MKKKVLSAVAVLVTLSFVVYVALILLNRPVQEHPFFADQPAVAVIAHQGGEHLWPSNTLYAFEQAVELGVDVLEMDIHSSADGVLVLSHDDTVDRLTDGQGRIQDLTFEELQTLDAGHYWTDDEGQSYPYRGQGITIPALEDVLASFPHMAMNIEIKQREPSIVVPFCEMLRRQGMEYQVLVASFHPDTMTEFRQTCPEVATSATEPEIRPFFALNKIFLDAAYPAPAEAFQVPEYSGGLHVVTGRFVRGAQRHNVDVHVWTVNEVEDMQRLLALGVDGIITDRPDRLLELLGR
ncbi:MAG TPA: glycerophosphodiester phosphodiesterase [Candidatus Sulfomarinibacteraceae bacterium]|nr:glycerophosphodiester phosphodiesterase [Candidatus Sulfomarinibacteraceae bacterium]